MPVDSKKAATTSIGFAVFLLLLCIGMIGDAPQESRSILLLLAAAGATCGAIVFVAVTAAERRWAVLSRSGGLGAALLLGILLAHLAKDRGAGAGAVLGGGAFGYVAALATSLVLRERKTRRPSNTDLPPPPMPRP